jgi:hypothetical protein
VFPGALVAPAASAAEATAAVGSLFTEINVVVDGRIDWICGYRHLGSREDFTLPRFNADGTTAAKQQTEPKNQPVLPKSPVHQ